ncbi:MAG: amino acid adenylation domain-containing protein [Microcoleus sp.]
MPEPEMSSLPSQVGDSVSGLVDFLSRLRSLDINVFIDGKILRCNAPEGVLTADIRAEIFNRKDEIIVFLKAANSTNANIGPVSREGILALSFAQQRLWFMDKLVPNNPFYNVPAAVLMTGAIDFAALQQSFNEIVRRHEALRTIFVAVNGQPVQKIVAAFDVPIAVLDLCNWPPAKRDIEADRLMTQEAQRPFNLATGPLLRVTLLQLSEAEYLLMLNMHHIVSDGWSIGVLIRELGVLYPAFSSQKPSPLRELSIQYADFARWQRDRLQGDVLEAQLAYWRRQLDGVSMLNLPTDRPRPAIQSYRGKRLFLQLPKQLSEGLETLSQREEVTLFMTMLAAFQTLLFRYSQQSDIAVGTPIANRNRSEIEALIGFFVNSLVLRTDLSGNPSFRELLQRVKEVALGAYAHQDVPFEKLVEELHPDRALNQNPLFQVVFALQNAPADQLKLPGLTLRPQQLDAGTARFDLEFHLWERSPDNKLWVDCADGISGFVIYSADLFDEATIVRMLEHFETLLSSIVANPDGQIANLEILTATERELLLVEYNKNQVNFSQNLGVHQLFERQAQRTPDAVALVLGEQQISYRELNSRSNKLASYLQKMGVGAEVLVGICLERSIEAIIGMLGILKAGGAYLPLDPTYPRDRLNLMLADARVTVVLTRREFKLEANREISESGEIDNPILVYLEEIWEIVDRENPDNPTAPVAAANLACVIYTSGSSGKPKGVQIEHRNLLNLIFWHQQEFAISAGDRTSQIAGIAFDAFGWEIWPALAAGASIYLAEDEIRISPDRLREWLLSNKITVSFVPTPLAEQLLLLDWSLNSALRILLTGGDKLRQYPSVKHPFQVVNNYGPTENTVVATSGIIPVREEADTAPAIGRAIANVQVYVLDQYLQPVPVGVAGELYLGGCGVARGYLNRPELTQEKFIPHPFAVKSELKEPIKPSQLYKTGDLVRYRKDGNLEFLGRCDEQVKIRGFRIELGEIESVLAQHPAVLQTVVTACPDGKGEKHLVAYISLNPECNIAETTEIQQLQAEQVLQWQMLYGETYKQPAIDTDPTFNITGWNSSYTGEPIPPEQVRQWANNQATKILKLQPDRVLEIGCGTGLLLFQIAPHCTQYCGTDFSPQSIDYIQQHLGDRDLANVTLLHKMAADFEGIETAAFDAIVLNSVVQYFPSIDYLLQVIEGAVKATIPGGYIFIGDVRSLPLLTAFHTAVELYRSPPATTVQQLQQRVQMQIFQETELVIEPDFFKALKHRFPQIEGVEIELLRGEFHNELTQFRYNAILHFASEIEPPNSPDEGGIFGGNHGGIAPTENQNLVGAVDGACPPRPTHGDFQTEDLTEAKVRQILVENQPDIFRISHVPNPRVAAAVQAAEWLSNSEKFKTVFQLQKALEQLPNLGIEPEIWYALDVPYTVHISWSNPSNKGCYDVVFVRGEARDFELAETFTRPRPWHSYANNPLQAKAARKLVPQLQAYLAAKLPKYMVPAAFAVLESLPLTPNGKVDRRALPAPELVKLESVGSYAAPQTPTEEVLARIWMEVLGIKRVGIRDNFFELGGHSLLATQLVSRVRDACGVELPLRCVFEAPTIAGLSELVDRLKQNNSQIKGPALVPVSRDNRRVKLSSLNIESKEK